MFHLFMNLEILMSPSGITYINVCIDLCIPTRTVNPTAIINPGSPKTFHFHARKITLFSSAETKNNTLLPNTSYGLQSEKPNQTML